MTDFSERLRELRIENGITQSALGKVIGTGADSICVYEKGRAYPEVRKLIMLADYFEVSLDYLVGRSDKPEINR